MIQLGTCSNLKYYLKQQLTDPGSCWQSLDVVPASIGQQLEWDVWTECGKTGLMKETSS